MHRTAHTEPASCKFFRSLVASSALGIDLSMLAVHLALCKAGVRAGAPFTLFHSIPRSACCTACLEPPPDAEEQLPLSNGILRPLGAQAKHALVPIDLKVTAPVLAARWGCRIEASIERIAVLRMPIRDGPVALPAL